jgi:AcrR family transcriptional regulator
MQPTVRAPGRPLDTAIDEQLLRATQDLLIKQGYERLTMDEVARQCGASKTTIYRRWPGKAALAVAAAAALFQPPEVPDTGDLREDLLACGRAYRQQEGRNAQVLTSVMSAAQHDPALRDAAQHALGAPYAGLFEAVLARAAERGVIRHGLDLGTLAQVFPAMAYHQVATQGRLISEDDVRRAVDAVLLPALSAAPDVMRAH